MKDFFKYTLATMTGIILLGVVISIIGIISVVGMIASEDATIPVKENSVFVLNLKGIVSERAQEDPLAFLLGDPESEQIGLDDITASIRKAQTNDDIKGIYIETGTVAFDSYATAQVIRDELLKFKKSGKWVVAYGDAYSQMSYYIASAADKVYLNNNGMIDLRGIGIMAEYDKGLFDKLGIKFQVARVGKYKSAVEGFIRQDMSPEDREQRLTYISGIWNKLTDDIAASRKLSAATLNSYVNDSIVALARQEDYVKAKLIDGLLFPEQIKSEIKTRLKLDKDDEINQLSLADMTKVKAEQHNEGEAIAVYYATGEIIDDIMSPFKREECIVGSEMSKDLRELADDDDIKAVVIRVNSPGGSAIASEQIHHAVELVKAKKPVVVSMGGVAASGGYMISAGANKIFAEPTTITGSIGIFGLLPNLSGLVTDKLGVTFDEVTTSKYANFEQKLTLAKENSDEMRHFQTYVDRGYITFLDIVAKGRKMTRDGVNEIAQGRVWIAGDALKHKLIDNIGSLDDAIAEAAKLAKAKEYHSKAYPEKSDWITDMIEASQGNKGSYLDAELREVLGDIYEPVMQLRLDAHRNRLQARLPFSTTIR